VGQLPVALQATDSVSHAGLAHLLESIPEVDLLGDAQQLEAKVVVLSADSLTPDVLAAMRRWIDELATSVVLVVNESTADKLVSLVERRMVTVLPRQVVTSERLTHAVLAAASGGSALPANLTSEGLKHIEWLRRDALAWQKPSTADLTTREIQILRLMADGFSTSEIAKKLRYSERTVKTAIHTMNRRLSLRNRPHAVAYAIRAGLI